MCSFVLVNFETCCTEMLVLYSSHYCLFLLLLWSQIGGKFGILCSCHGAMLYGILAIILCCWIPSCCAIKRMFGFMAWQIPFGVIMYSAVSQIEIMWIGSLGPHMFWGTRATNFSIYTTKMGGARLHIVRHWGQIQTGTMPKKLLCKPGLSYALCCCVVL